jgi:alkylation response protein AidB-like acyl-CoA dehydrogenase
MDFSYSDDQQALLDLAAQILADRATPERLKQLERSAAPRYDADLWGEFARAGLVGIGIPEALGGSGFGFLEVAGVLEQVGRRTAPLPYLETVVMGSLPLVAFGSAAQHQDLLPRIAAGELVLTAALVEPEGDPLFPTTRAEAAGNGWRLSGVKLAVPYAEVAQRVLVPAVTAEGKVGLFFVDPTAAGVALTPLQTTSGIPEAMMTLDGVAVGDDDRLGTVDAGAAILAWIVERVNAAQASLALGVCAEALHLTAEYTKNRKQFGQPIASFQAAGHRAADAYIDTEAIRLTARQAAWRIATGLPAAEQVAVAKFYAADAGHRIVHAAQHLHGGVGVDRDYPLHRYFVYARHIELTLGHGNAQLRHLGALIAAGTGS